jgi:hypothetical protein
MSEAIPATPEALEEALALSADILSDIELSRVPLVATALKTARLARLLNDFHMQEVFEAEASGYRSTPSGVPPESWRLLESAGRTQEEVDGKTKETRTVAYVESIEQLEHLFEGAKLALQAAGDRDISISSANPQQYVSAPMGNSAERTARLQFISTTSSRLASRRAFVYGYASRRHYELKFSGEAQNVFSALREAVDRGIGDTVPAAVQKFVSVHENLKSQNPEDWSNAVHSCRRILQDLADAVFPPQSEDRIVTGGQKVSLGQDKYINRLVCYAQDNSDSDRFLDLVGSHLRFLGDRLDAVFQAAQKGSHSTVSHANANRYVVYTYMLVADILSLAERQAGVGGTQDA